MATVNKPGLARFLQDCGVTLSASEVAPNMLHARTAQTLGEVSAATSKEQERNAQQIAEMIGLFVSPDFGSAGDGVAAVTRVRLDEFKRRIGGRPKAFVAFLVPAAHNGPPLERHRWRTHLSNLRRTNPSRSGRQRR